MIINRYKSMGFTLLELLIVVIIVGILAAVAIPQFTNATDRSRESEGRNAIGALLTAEAAYYQERGIFTTATSDLISSVGTMTQWLTPVITSGTAAVTISLNGNSTGHAHAAHILRGVMTDAGTRFSSLMRPAPMGLMS